VFAFHFVAATRRRRTNQTIDNVKHKHTKDTSPPEWEAKFKNVNCSKNENEK
jgi:hypothetical protein